MTGCDRSPWRAGQLCKSHYDHERNLWKPDSEVLCAIPGCERPVTRIGACNPHGSAYYQGRLPEDLHQYLTLPANPKVRPACSVEGCETTSSARGLCGPHYTRWRASTIAGQA